MRWPYTIYRETAEGWLASAALLYAAFALFSGIALANDGGKYVLIAGAEGHILGFLFLSAALGYFAWVHWLATTFR